MASKHIEQPIGRRNADLADHISAIRQLGKQAISNIIEIGRRLTVCKDLVGHRNFGCWLDNEFGWSERTAQRFMSVHELAETKSDKLSDLELPVSAIYLLAAPSTPQPVRAEILERAEAGEKMTVEAVKEAIAEAKPQVSKRTGADGKTRKQCGHDTPRDRGHAAHLPTRKTATRPEAKKATVEDASGIKRWMADVDRVQAILVERIGLEELTLIWAAMMVCEGALCLNDTINVPGTDGADVFAKMTAREFTIKDFLAKYSGKGGELGETKRTLEIKIKGYESEIAELKNEVRDLKAAKKKKKKSVTTEKLAEADDPFLIPPECDRTRH